MNLRPAVLALLMLLPTPAGAQVAITYLGNEGVLLNHAGTVVLIDALQGPYKGYSSPPADMRQKLLGAEPPYDGVDLILVSHVHGDHFNAELIAAHLTNNSGARLVSSDQVVNGVLQKLPSDSPASRRTEALALEPGRTMSVSRRGAKVRVLGLPHGGRRWSEIRNLGHVVELGGVKILHVGDADMDPARFAGFGLVGENIDVALLPYWFLIDEQGRELIREHIRPKKIVAVHMDVSKEAEITLQVKDAFPNAEVFSEIGTTLEIGQD